MDATANNTDDETTRVQSQATRDGPTESPPLECVVVRYENKPDQCTLSPVDCSDEATLTTWLTAATETFVGLDECR